MPPRKKRQNRVQVRKTVGGLRAPNTAPIGSDVSFSVLCATGAGLVVSRRYNVIVEGRMTLDQVNKLITDSDIFDLKVLVQS